GIACQDERNGVPWHNRGARSSTTLPEGIGKDFVRGTTAINDKMLIQAARTLDGGGTFKLTTGSFALKDPELVSSWIRTLEQHGVGITSSNCERGVTLMGVKRR
ncbi:MAG: hypothetical protein ACYC6Y_16435, partial [Thermoguttaceae bacterium]